jgi:hypothetical protein
MMRISKKKVINGLKFDFFLIFQSLENPFREIEYNIDGSSNRKPNSWKKNYN